MVKTQPVSPALAGIRVQGGAKATVLRAKLSSFEFPNADLTSPCCWVCVNGSDKVYHRGVENGYHGQDEKELNGEPGGDASGESRRGRPMLRAKIRGDRQSANENRYRDGCTDYFNSFATLCLLSSAPLVSRIASHDTESASTKRKPPSPIAPPHVSFPRVVGWQSASGFWTLSLLGHPMIRRAPCKQAPSLGSQTTPGVRLRGQFHRPQNGSSRSARSLFGTSRRLLGMHPVSWFPPR